MAKKPAETSKIQEIRHANFMALLEEFTRTNKGRGPINRFAEYVSEKGDEPVSANYISRVKAKNRGIGDDFVPRLEKAFKKPKGWMDMEHPWWEPRNAGEVIFLQTAIGVIREIRPEYTHQVIDAIVTTAAKLRDK